MPNSIEILGVKGEYGRVVLGFKKQGKREVEMEMEAYRSCAL